MTRTKEIKKDVLENSLLENSTEKLAIEDMPLESLGDYRRYNEEARKINKRLKVLRYPIKQCPVELHPKQKVMFSRIDQPENMLHVYLSNHLIHFEMDLYPGKEYELPECVIHHLSTRGYPIWKWFDNPDGSKETKIDHLKPRFSLRNSFSESY